jgi:aspartyl-tRNA(Asn)/glutamyl-tRNA(Gln) amidotransferase subunit B
MLDLTYETPKPKLISGAKHDWELVIGLEVHAQISSKAKLFSGASTQFGAEPNSNVTFVDSAMPGMLPVINEFCVEQAVRTGLGLNAVINLKSAFDRKNYFYPDSPQGYQISQLYEPIVGEGEILVDMAPGIARPVRVERIHIEQDAGKSIHDMDPAMSFIDFNRTCVPLMEIVSRPDIRGPEEAAAYVAKLRQILRYLGTCDGNMEEGSMRCDVNLSIRRPGEALGTRTETKNVNSVRFVQQAIESEVRRQIEVVEAGGAIVQETRLFDPKKGETRTMRSKEEAHDYRYFPDPDILPLELDPAWIEELRAELPELPDEKKARFIADYRLSAEDADVLVADRANADFYEAVIVAGGRQRDPKTVANWVVTNYFGVLHASDHDLTTAPVDATKLGGLIDLIADDTISGRIAKEVFETMWETGKDAAAIVEEKGLKQISDSGEIEAIVDWIVADNPKQVTQYAGGENPKMIGWFVGQVMKATQGKANPGLVNKLLKQKLGG